MSVKKPITRNIEAKDRFFFRFPLKTSIFFKIWILNKKNTIKSRQSSSFLAFHHHIQPVEGHFQPQASTPDLSTPDFSTINFPTPDFSTPDFSTMNFSTPDFSTPDFPTPSLGLKNPGLESSWLKSPGLKGLGLKLGVEMSFNLDIYLFDTILKF